MINHDRAVSHPAGPVVAVRGWALWSIPASARSFLLVVEALAAGLSSMLLVTQPVSPGTLVRVGVLAGLAIGYAECAARIERLKRYLGGGRKVFADQLGVWTFAAALTVPAGWAAVLVTLIYAHVLVQRHREKSGDPYRVVFTAAAVILGVLATNGVLHAAGGGDVLHSGLLGPVAVVLALLVFTLTNCALMLSAMWLTARPPSLRAALPDTDALGYELATLVLGIFTAEFLVHVPALTPLVLVLAAYLHRSSLVNALHHAALIDAKTGLLTLAAWTEHAQAVLSRSSRDATPVTVLFCDLDRFKSVNDVHGHLLGDQVLVAVAACLGRELRGHDGLGRFGGEEFVVILDRLTLAAAELVAERLRTAISALHFEPDLHITVSIGLAHHEPLHDPTDLQSLLTRADTALHQAKASGRDRIHAA